MYTGQTVSQIVFREHNLTDFCKILRLIFFHPQNLRCGKSGKCDIRRIFRQFFFSDHLIQIIGFFCGSPVVPQNRRADHLILLIQNNQTMHLSAKADTCHFRRINLADQFLDSLF